VRSRAASVHRADNATSFRSVDFTRRGVDFTRRGVDFTRSRRLVGFRRGPESRRSLGAFTVASSTWEVWTLPA
jgi:hypothetical protein